MAQYWISIYHPDDYDLSVEDEAMGRDIDALNDAMVAAGVRVFVGGLQPVAQARSVRGDAGAEEGPYLKSSEHVAGFWVLEVESLDAALEWGRKAAVACRAPVQVRRFN